MPPTQEWGLGWGGGGLEGGPSNLEKMEKMFIKYLRLKFFLTVT